MNTEKMAQLKILRCGAYGSVQDMGRKGYRHWGIPVSGALDENSAQTANLLSGNAENYAVLELIGPGWEMQFSDDAVIAVSGANWSPEINKNPVPLHQRLTIKAGSVLSMKQAGSGRIAYLSIQGGIFVSEILGSRSWHPYLTKDFMLKKNMLLPYPFLSDKNSYSQIQSLELNVSVSEIISAEQGPEWHLLSNESRQQILSMEWSLKPDSNRMAYLVEEKLTPNTLSILTSAVWPGIVQMTPSGKMMILMKDAQTTGGYPRILSIPQKELNKIAQKNPGERFRFIIPEWT